MTLTEQVQNILDTHHAPTKAKLPAIATRIAALRQSRNGDAHVERLARSFAQIKAEMESHMMKEEMILFPMIGRIEASGSVGLSGCGVEGPINQMNYEHREAKMLLLEMTDAVNRITGIDSEIRAEVAWLNVDLYEHIRKEEEELFPSALKASGVAVAS